MSGRSYQKIVSVFLLCGFCFSLQAATRVAVGVFKNESPAFYLDQWESMVPDLLQAKLAESENLTVLERRRLESVLQEHALAMSGLSDSLNARRAGELLNAEYVITGTIHYIDGEYRIDANIVRVSSGEIRTEKAVSRSAGHLEKMTDLLANNIAHSLTGAGRHKDQIQLKGYPTTYFLGATLGLAVITGVVRSQYEKHLQDYRDNTDLDRFNELYDRANRTNKASIALASATGTALLGTLYCWLRNRSPERIYARAGSGREFAPYLAVLHKNEVNVGLQIRF